MVVKVIFQNEQLDIFQGSKITIYGKLEDQQSSSTFATRFAGVYVFQKFLRSSLPHICKDFFRHFISYSLYIILSYIVNTRKLAEYGYVSE